MKIHLLTIFIFTLFLVLRGGVVYPQVPSAKLLCLYKMTSRPDSTSKTTWEEITQLAISDSLSEFRSLARYKADSLLIKYENTNIGSPESREGLNEVSKLPKYKFNGVVVKSVKSKKCFYYGVIDKVLYSYQENNYPMNWRVFPDTMSINGYKCQKASIKFGGRNYIAWFTRQIPIDNGPYKFGGLPGLIVLISDTTNSYKFELIRVYIPNNNYKIYLPSQVLFSKHPAITISKKKFYTSYFNARDNFIDKSVSSGIMKFDDEEYMRKSYKDKIKRRNNHIELDYEKL